MKYKIDSRTADLIDSVTKSLELDSGIGQNDPRYSLRFQKSHRKQDRKEKRMQKKNRKNAIQSKSHESTDLQKKNQWIENQSIEKKRVNSMPIESSDSKDRQERQLRKLQESNPGFYRLIQQKRLAPDVKRTIHNQQSDAVDSDSDEERLKHYAKKLKIKNGKLNKSFERDGLDFLLDGISKTVDAVEESASEGESASEIVSEEPKSLPSKYIPPHLRAQSDGGKSDKYLRLERQLKGLLNRLSDANLESILAGIEESLSSNSRHDVTAVVTDVLLSYIGDQAMMLESFIVTYAGLVASLHQVVGIEFAAHFIQTTVERFDASRKLYLESADLNKESTSKRCINYAVLVAVLYNMHVVSCLLVYDMVRIAINSLSELDVEVLLSFLKLSGHQLRSDDPLALKEIVLLINEASAKIEAPSMRFKFMVQTILDLKNNKRVHGHQADIKSALHQQQDHLRKVVTSISKKRSVSHVEALRVSLDDIRSIETKGKWWLVGSAWAGNTSTNAPTSNTSATTASAELLALAKAQKMNTDVRRSIFIVLMSSEDCMDAFERLLKLNLKEKQEREIVRVLVRCCTQEQAYNPYYALVAEQLCRHSYSFKITFQYTLWDALKTMSDDVGGSRLDGLSDEASDYHGKDGVRATANLARLIASLIIGDSLSFAILKTLEFTSLSQPQVLFMRIVLGHVCVKTGMRKKHSEEPVADEAFERVFSRIKSQHELLHFSEGLLLFIQTQVVTCLSPDCMKLFALDKQHFELLKRRVKLLKRHLI